MVRTLYFFNFDLFLKMLDGSIFRILDLSPLGYAQTRVMGSLASGEHGRFYLKVAFQLYSLYNYFMVSVFGSMVWMA